MNNSSSTLPPVVFLSHGAGPCWFMDGSKSGALWVKEIDMNSKSADFMRNLCSAAGLPLSPAAILVVSAHWEEDEFTVQTSEKPSLYFDYSNFPEHTYHLKWPVPGSVKYAERTEELLNKAGFKCVTDNERGLDHGVFIPLMLAYPDANVPVFQLSLRKGLDIAEHLAVGEVLQELRKENILIIGSGQSTHSPIANNHQVPEWCLRFRNWFHDVLTNASYTSQERKRMLLDSACEASFYKAHPLIEHYLPAPMMSAVAGYAPSELLFEQIVGNTMLMSNIKFK